MSEKLLDTHGRWRNRTVAFRVSEEEAKLIDSKVALSGLSKQDYITRRLTETDVVVVPNSRFQKAAVNEMQMVYCELRRLRDGSQISPELACRIEMLSDIFVALGAGTEETSEVEREDDMFAKIERGRPARARK